MNWRDEWRALARFVHAPRRLSGHHVEGEPWWPRLLWLSAIAIVLGVAADTAMTPLAAWAGATSVLPERVTAAFVFGALLFAPIVEELLFRAGLRRVDYTLGFGPLLIAAAMLPWNRTTLTALAVAACAVLVLLHLAVRTLRHRTRLRMHIARTFVRRYPWVFWLYTLAFALAHAGNYDWGNARTVLVAPLLILPQLMIGICLGYIRLRDGLRSSMLMHLLVNATALLLLGAGV